MKHIETPVRVCGSGFAGLFCVRDAAGDRLTGPLSLLRRQAREISDAVNAYDAHVARIAELEAQVDALAGVCEALYSARRMWCAATSELATDTFVSDAMKAACSARTALALVRGKGDE